VASRAARPDRLDPRGMGPMVVMVRLAAGAWWRPSCITRNIIICVLIGCFAFV
jgi:hypothetical protein